MNNLPETIEHHYWRAVTFLVVLILAGTGFWGVRRFAPELFLGTPDFIAVPKGERPPPETGDTQEQIYGGVKALEGEQPPPETRNTPKLPTERVDTPELLNINTASSAALETLPNIGPKMADRIITYRAENGDFANVEALQNVRGIGPKTLEKLKPFIDVK